MIETGDDQWLEVVRWGASAIVDAARRGDGNFTYTDLAGAVNEYVDDAQLSPHGEPMNRLLFGVVLEVLAWHRATEGNDDGPMVSAVVTYKDPTNRIPGPGFWTLARTIEDYGFSPGWDVPTGRDQAELIAFWANQQQRSFQYFTPARARQCQRHLRALRHLQWDPR